jgi:hypothetical protein
MKMSPALLAGIEADLPHIGRGNVSTAKDCVQELFPLNCLLAHADTMPMRTAKIRKQYAVGMKVGVFTPLLSQLSLGQVLTKLEM